MKKKSKKVVKGRAGGRAAPPRPREALVEVRAERFVRSVRALVEVLTGCGLYLPSEVQGAIARVEELLP